MGSKAKTPKAPDYAGLANQQAALAQQQWQKQLTAARPDQQGPTGSVTWEQSPTGEWTQNTSLSPEVEALRQQGVGRQGQVGGLAEQALGGYDAGQVDFSGAPAMPGVADYSKLGAAPEAVDYGKELGAMPEVGGYNQQVIDTLRQLQAPDLARRRGAQDARLAAMGMGTGSGQAWQSAQQALGDTENRADLNAILSGISQGNTEYGQALQGRGQRAGELGQTWQQGMAGRQQGVSELDKQFAQGMQGRQQGVSEALSEKTANLGQLTGLMGLAGNYNPNQFNPQFQSFQTPGAGANTTPDLTGAANSQYQASLDKANAENASNPWNKIVGIGSNLAGAYAGSTTGSKNIGSFFGK